MSVLPKPCRSTRTLIAAAVVGLVAAALTALASLPVAGARSAAVEPTAARSNVVHAAGAAPIRSGRETPFLLETTGAKGVRLTLRSPADGRTVVDFGQVSRREGFTNNGLSVSPDHDYVYLTLIRRSARPGLEIARLSAKTHRLSLVAYGSNPTVSPDGRLLAYAAAGRGGDANVLALRDLASGRTERLSLERLVGARESIFNGRMAWTANGSELLLYTSEIVAAGPPRPGAAPAPPRARGCSARPVRLCLVVVHLHPAGALPRLTAARLHTRVAIEPTAIATDSSRPDAVSIIGPSTISGNGRHGLTFQVERLVLGHGVPTARLVLSTGRFLVAVSPDEREVVYLKPKSRSLWAARVQDGRLRGDHRLIARVSFGDAEW